MLAHPVTVDASGWQEIRINASVNTRLSPVGNIGQMVFTSGCVSMGVIPRVGYVQPEEVGNLWHFYTPGH